MADYALRFYRDVFAPGAGRCSAPPAVRTIYVRSGYASIDGDKLGPDEALFRDCKTDIVPGSEGVTLWRYEFALLDSASVFFSDATTSDLLLEARLTTLPQSDGLMMRCDSVEFPPGGCAYTHTHKGPGIRCLEKGTIRIDSDGHSTHFNVEEPWFEAGPVPVFAQADAQNATRFIRISILPRTLKGKSSITYVLPEDQDKPKSQTYQSYFDEFFDE